MLCNKGLWCFIVLFLMVFDIFHNPAFLFFSLYSSLGWLDVNIMFLCVSFKSNYEAHAQRRANISRVKTHNIPCSYATEWENKTAVYTTITLGMSECISALPPRRL